MEGASGRFWWESAVGESNDEEEGLEVEKVFAMDRGVGDGDETV